MRDIELLPVVVLSLLPGSSPSDPEQAPGLHGVVPSHRPTSPQGTSDLHSQPEHAETHFTPPHARCSKLALVPEQSFMLLGLLD